MVLQDKKSCGACVWSGGRGLWWLGRGAEGDEATGREGKAENESERKNHSYNSWVFIEAG